MARASNIEIREAILAVAEAQRPRDRAGNLQSGSVLGAVIDKLAPNSRDPELEEAILTQFHDLLRTGVFAWGVKPFKSESAVFSLHGSRKEGS